MSKAKLFVGMMYSDERLCNKVVSKLVDNFGPVEIESESYLFDFTKYYEEEMGNNLWKKFIVFKFFIDKKELAKIKVFTNSLEDKYKVEDKRQINLDPGYLDKNEVVLASVKKQSYRFYLGKEIFGQKIYEFENNDVKVLKQTFPDFKSVQVKEFFLDLRDRLNL